MYSYSRFIHNYTDSSFVYELEQSMDFQVWLNDEEIPVYTCDVSKNPFNTVWPGHQRPFNQTKKASYINLVSDEVIHIKVKSRVDKKDVVIKPFSEKIAFDVKGDTIAFTLTQNGQYVL